MEQRNPWNWGAPYASPEEPPVEPPVEPEPEVVEPPAEPEPTTDAAADVEPPAVDTHKKKGK